MQTLFEGPRRIFDMETTSPRSVREIGHMVRFPSTKRASANRAAACQRCCLPVLGGFAGCFAGFDFAARERHMR